MSPVILGTRGSALALAQTALALAALRQALPGGQFLVHEVKTTGDRRQDLSLTHLAPGGQGYEAAGTASEPEPRRVDPGLFTRELEVELLAGRISVAVHSLKDLPTALPEGLTLAAVLPRADTADVLIIRDGPPAAATPAIFPLLPPGATVATSSLRRQRQLQWRRPDLRITEVRGNVGTRLDKLSARADWGALVLARAGLDRLGLGEGLTRGVLESGAHRFQVEILGADRMLPAVGQGAIGLQARADDTRTLEALAAINHLPTWAAIRAERRLLALLGGGCQMPLGVSTGIHGNDLRLEAILFSSADSPPRFASALGPVDDPLAVAQHAAAQLL